MLPQIQERGSREYYYASGQKLGYRKPDSRQKKLIRPEPFNPDSSQRISENIQKEQLAFIFFVFSVQKQQDKQDMEADIPPGCSLL